MGRKPKEKRKRNPMKRKKNRKRKKRKRRKRMRTRRMRIWTKRRKRREREDERRNEGDLLPSGDEWTFCGDGECPRSRFRIGFIGEMFKKEMEFEMKCTALNTQNGEWGLFELFCCRN